MAIKEKVKVNKKAKKETFVANFISYLETYNKILVVHADNVGSTQFANIRKDLRGKAVIQMGKKTLFKKALKDYIESGKNKEVANKVAALDDLLKGNVGLVFTNSDFNEVRGIIGKNQVGAPARQGAVSPVEVTVPASNTGLEPTKTSFFQALNIQTKITKGTVEITKPHRLLKVGDKVGSSEATLLQMLNIKPFFYGLQILTIYDDGSVYSPAVLDLTDAILSAKFSAGLNNVASVSLALGIPTEASVPHSLANAFKDLLAIAANTQFSFPEAQETLEFLKDPTKFAVEAPVAAPATTTAAPAAKKADTSSESESEDDDAFGGLF